MSTLSIFDAAREAPEAPALVDGGVTLTFAQAARRVQPLAAALLAARLPALALTPHADTESLLWLWAAFATGTPVLPLHQRATSAERARSLQLSGACEPPEVSPAGEVAALPAIDDATTLAYVATSGSTGAPRLVQLSRRAWRASAEASAQNLGWEPHDRWLLCLPLAHTGGLSIVTRCLLARRAVVLFEPGPSGVLAQIGKLVEALASATLVSLVPSVLGALLDAGLVAPPGLRAVLVGGAGCSAALAGRAYAARLPLLTSYGLTETASQVVTRRYAERYDPLPVRAGVVSSGHALPGVTMRLMGETISVRAPSLFSGYLGEAAPATDTEGFLHTSDRGELGDDDELYVRGRSDDVIISGGENVDPLQVEAALAALPGVQAACVFGTASETFGEVVSAVLVSDDAALADARHLSGLLEGRLARHQRPRRALLVASLPLTPSGKVDRRACKARYSVELEARAKP